MDREKILRDKIVPLKGITFDDILLLPRFADFKRCAVDLTTVLHPRLILKLPIIASPMDTVCEETMAIAMAQAGGLGIIHRNLTIGQQKRMVETVKLTTVSNIKNAAVDADGKLLVGAAVGVGTDMRERVNTLEKAKCDLIVIDSGHGHSQPVIETLAHIKKNHPALAVAAGNVATHEGARALIQVGCDVLRVGMGPGSICTTRIVTGMGVPQITVIAEAVRAVGGSSVTVIADGGIRQIGDMAKALAFGASAVMLGSLLARCDEAPGESVVIKGKKYKQYRGMGSVGAMRKGSAQRYGQLSTDQRKTMIAEGIDGLVEYGGTVADYLVQIAGSLRSSLYYVGVQTLPDFFHHSRCIRISPAGFAESHPHSVIVRDAGKNYTV